MNLVFSLSSFFTSASNYFFNLALSSSAPSSSSLSYSFSMVHPPLPLPLLFSLVRYQTGDHIFTSRVKPASIVHALVLYLLHLRDHATNPGLDTMVSDEVFFQVIEQSI